MEAAKRSKDPAENPSGAKEDKPEKRGKMQWKTKGFNGESTYAWLISLKNKEMKRLQEIIREIQEVILDSYTEGLKQSVSH